MNGQDSLRITPISELQQASESFVKLLSRLRADLGLEQDEFESIFHGHYIRICDECITEINAEIGTDIVEGEAPIFRKHRITTRKAKEAATRLSDHFKLPMEDRTVFECVLSYCYLCRLKLYLPDPLLELLKQGFEG